MNSFLPLLLEGGWRPSLPPSSSLSFPPSLPSLRKRLRQKQRRPAARRKRERGREERLFSTRKERGRYRSSAAADADDGEGRREREGGQWCVSHAACARPPSLSSSPTGQAQAGGALQMTGRPPSPLSLAGSSIYLTLHGARVELAHVDALVVELDVGDM